MSVIDRHNSGSSALKELDVTGLDKLLSSENFVKLKIHVVFSAGFKLRLLNSLELLHPHGAVVILKSWDWLGQDSNNRGICLSSHMMTSAFHR